MHIRMPVLDHSLCTIFQKKIKKYCDPPSPTTTSQKAKIYILRTSFFFLPNHPQGRSPPGRFWVNALVICKHFKRLSPLTSMRVKFGNPKQRRLRTDRGR